MNRLRNYIGEQHTISIKLEGVLEGLVQLHNADLAADAQSALMLVAHDLAVALSDNLDSVNLSCDGEA